MTEVRRWATKCVVFKSLLYRNYETCVAMSEVHNGIS